ncbi:very-long-chain aldehyde decarbonylase GL1-10-like isoform X4 [Oryza glaberrima]|uniref:very-long-chain aldehyde decarbonylase GL1-10-like isoform X4 n=1 Tax=Oryza glaberrima TaxID=4538 RepID=UPI00224C0E35|nr:very-long-chain aldehyde decarbonylase GL1-10-like isoform X4 [Oryza glaberrima]
MLPYATAAEAEAAVGRGLTWAEAAWFRYSASIPDYCLYCHNVPILLLVYTLAPLPLALLELRRHLPLPHKLQPGVRHPPAAFLRCYAATARVLLLAVGPVQLASFPAVRAVGIRTGLPLPSAGETAAQVAVYLLVEDYLGYWIHRLLHTPWAYHHIHRVHHEFTAPMGYAAPYAHWAEILILGFPAFAGPAIVPCHMTTFWLWFKLPFDPTKYIPLYGGVEYHDYHHFVGGHSQSNFSSVFTFCDYIYGTDRGYRYHKLKEMAGNHVEKGDENGFANGKQD